MESHQSFETLTELSSRTGLPESWLKSEALSGRLPFIKVSRRIMFPREHVDQVLVERAIENVGVSLTP